MADEKSESDFTWNDTESVIIDRVDAIAVYSNPKGDVVIRQEGNMSDDSFIIIPRSRVGDLIRALEREVQT